MKKLFFYTLFIILIIPLITSCGKDSMVTDDYFSVHINSITGEYEPHSVKIDNGITIIAGRLQDEKRTESVVITVKGDRAGEYKQVFDYKTGVSVTSCGLTYKIVDKLKLEEATYYNSYEGIVLISEIDGSTHQISGSYKFLVSSIDNDTTVHEIKGEFLNVEYQ